MKSKKLKKIKRKLKHSSLYKLYKALRKKKNTLMVYIKCRIKGYSSYMSKAWASKVHYDLIKKNGKTKKEKKWAHNRGFLSSNIDNYGLNDNNYKDFVTDFEYMFLTPINNGYEKWLTDRLTPYYILQPFKEMLPEIHYNVLLREDEVKYISLKDYSVKDTEHFIETLESEKKLLLVPSQTKRRFETFLFEFKEDTYWINGEEYDKEAIIRLVGNAKRYYLIRTYVETSDEIKEMFYGQEPVFKFILNNDENNETNILCTAVQLERPYVHGLKISKRHNKYKVHEINIDMTTGRFEKAIEEDIYQGCIPNWNDICEKIKGISSYMSEIEYVTLFAKITDDGIKLIDYGIKPDLPERLAVDSPLNIYLKDKASKKRSRLDNKELVYKKPMKRRVIQWLQKHYFRKGFREYMLTVWLDTVKDDFINTKCSLSKKIWAWKRGFPSYRIEQYGLNNENANKILSDYDYAWLNRINNDYQKWINDKLTMRYYFEPLKEHLPEYYYYVAKKNNAVFFKSLQDLPKNYSNKPEDIIKLLIEKGKLVFKPNAGTHGDGFYKFEYVDGEFYINNDVVSEQDIVAVLHSQKSTYVVTDYLEMHSHLKEIYAGSVNTIRIMVLNRDCDDPKIVQTYMRVGTSKTGVTDNIAYGGIAVYVNKDTGFYDRAGLLMDHKYHDIDKHPDTGTVLEGVLPNWDIVKDGVKKIAGMIPQMEYMGFDLVITEEGFKILEINIHQDLHKSHEFTPEINEFFNRKKELKMKSYYK